MYFWLSIISWLMWIWIFEERPHPHVILFQCDRSFTCNGMHQVIFILQEATGMPLSIKFEFNIIILTGWWHTIITAREYNNSQMIHYSPSKFNMDYFNSQAILDVILILHIMMTRCIVAIVLIDNIGVWSLWTRRYIRGHWHYRIAAIVSP